VASASTEALDRDGSVPIPACDVPHTGLLPPRKGLRDASKKTLAAVNETLLLCAPS